MSKTFTKQKDWCEFWNSKKDGELTADQIIEYAIKQVLGHSPDYVLTEKDYDKITTIGIFDISYVVNGTVFFPRNTIETNEVINVPNQAETESYGLNNLSKYRNLKFLECFDESILKKEISKLGIDKIDDLFNKFKKLQVVNCAGLIYSKDENGNISCFDEESDED